MKFCYLFDWFLDNNFLWFLSFQAKKTKAETSIKSTPVQDKSRTDDAENKRQNQRNVSSVKQGQYVSLVCRSLLYHCSIWNWMLLENLSFSLYIVKWIE